MPSLTSRSFRACVLTLLLGGLATAASAQVFVGSDNFNDNTLTLDSLAGEQPGVWSYSVPGAGGAWTETGQHLEYTNTNSTGFNRGFLVWVDSQESYTTAGGAGLSAGNPYNSSWTAQVSASNLMTSLSSGYALAGLEIYSNTNGAGGRNAYYGIYLNTNPGGSNLQFEWGRWNAGITDFDRTTTQVATVDTSDVILRMSFDATTKNLALDYSFNGGVNFITGTTFDLDGAQAGIAAPFNNGFGLELTAIANNAGQAITTGQLTFDNLNVSAVPEPSTYAAIAGLGALGLALWRKRRQTAS